MFSLTINQQISLNISALGTNGEGIGKLGDYTVFVPFTCIGETVSAKIIHCKGKIAYAKLEKVLVSNNCGRVSPKCKVFGKCGGCQIQHLNYEKQLEFKKKLVEGNLKKIGKIQTQVLPVVASHCIYGYRNKLQLPVFEDSKCLKLGFYGSNSHVGVPIETCPLHGNFCDMLIETVKSYATKFAIPAYDHITYKGLLRHVVARELDGQLLVVVVINGKILPYADELAEILNTKFENYGLFVSSNTSHSNQILGSDIQHLYGIKNIASNWSGIYFTLKPESFFQVNTDIKNKLYTKVKELIYQNTELVIDAYAGAGLLSGFLAAGFRTVGIEVNPAATADANQVKNINNLVNLTNINGDAAVCLPKILEENQNSSTTVVLDPPRKGVDKYVIDALNTFLPQQIVYISCDSATLARDLMQLSESYTVSYCQPFDMFPQTKHVETLVCLHLKDTYRTKTRRLV